MTDMGDMADVSAHLVGQLGAEASYLQEIRDELIREISDLETDKLDDAAKMAKAEDALIRRRIGRTEKLLGKEGEKISVHVKELTEVLPPKLAEYLKELHGKIDIGLKDLVAKLSRGQGAIRQEVDKVKGMIATAQDLEKNGEEASVIRGQADDLAKTILSQVNQTLKWIMGTEVEVKELEAFERHLNSL